jgi:hypothetical protein
MAINKQLILCLCTISALATACANPISPTPAEGSAAVGPTGFPTRNTAGDPTSDDHVYVVTATEQTRLELGVASYEVTKQNSRRISVRALDASGHEVGTLAIAQAENGVALLAVQSGGSTMELTLSDHDKAVITSARLDGRDISIDELMSAERTGPVAGATVHGDAVRVFSRFDEDRQRAENKPEVLAARGGLGTASEDESGPCLACLASVLALAGSSTGCAVIVTACLAGTAVTIGGVAVPCGVAILGACGGAGGAIIATINSCSECFNPICVPATCATWSFSVCGPQADGCGGTVNCSCTPGNVCTAQQLCVPHCTPQTCDNHPNECGNFNDGCGGSITCGSYDECGVCNGDGSSCGCAWYDDCGVCEGDDSTCGGGCAWYDDCGVCEGDDSTCGGGGGGGCDEWGDCGCGPDEICPEDFMARPAFSMTTPTSRTAPLKPRLAPKSRLAPKPRLAPVSPH